MDPLYCLFWTHRWAPLFNEWMCQSAGVWAAWAQALLSAGAVFYSVRVTKKLHALDGVLQRNANRQAAIDRVTGFIDAIEMQLAAFDRVGAWVNGSAGFDKNLHSEIHHRGQVIDGYVLQFFEPLDARWLVAKCQASASLALKYYQRVWEQRNSPGVKKEFEDPIIAAHREGLTSARADIITLKDWCNRQRAALE